MIFRVRDNPLWQLDQIRLHLCHAEWKYYTEIVHSQKSSIPIAASALDPVSAYSTGLCEVEGALVLRPLRERVTGFGRTTPNSGDRACGS